jgi:hypothetical protein
MTPQLTYRCGCGRVVDISWSPLSQFSITEMLIAMNETLRKLGWVLGTPDTCPDCRVKQDGKENDETP